ncbi:MAG TPA: FKBP-type peptidyl-prolyl cis-trans isomerase [Bacteroidales bacterium]|nr:FKBP-type peptidyl-prolyl cis-trans isomerase [Bacteroidales bacterium]
MEIEKNKVVSLVYELRVDGKEGEIVETLNDSNPLTFIYGVGNLLPKFESNINGLKVGDSFDFMLKSEEAYGLSSDEAVVDVPKEVFIVDGKFDSEMVKEGNAIPMMDGDGNRLNGIVVNVTDNAVKMDFNHPLADEDLFFAGKVVGVREATEEELSHGHIHQSGG